MIRFRQLVSSLLMAGAFATALAAGAAAQDDQEDGKKKGAGDEEESQELERVLNPALPQGKGYEGATPLTPGFAFPAPETLTVPPGLDCDAAAKGKLAFVTYNTVVTALFAGTDPSTIEYLRCFLPDAVGSTDAEAVRVRMLSEVFDADVMYAYLDQALNGVIWDAIQQGKTRQGRLAWNSGHLGDAAYVAYIKTGQERFMRRYLDHFALLLELTDQKLGLHDDFHDRVMNSWGSANLGSNSGNDSMWVAHVTHFSTIMGPATAFAARILADPALAVYRPEAERIVAFFDAAYPQFDGDLRQPEGTEEQWYWRPLLGKFEATNHLHVQGEALLNMYAATGNPVYAEKVRAIIRIFEKGAIIDDQGFAAWNYHPYFQIEKAKGDHNAVLYSEYVWKAALTVPFLYAAEAAGFEIRPELMTAVTRSIRDFVVADNSYKLNVNPKDSGDLTSRDYRKGWTSPAASIAGFLSASVDDPVIADRIRMMVATRPDLYPKGWFVSDKLARAYPWFLH